MFRRTGALSAVVIIALSVSSCSLFGKDATEDAKEYCTQVSLKYSELWSIGKNLTDSSILSSGEQISNIGASIKGLETQHDSLKAVGDELADTWDQAGKSLTSRNFSAAIAKLDGSKALLQSISSQCATLAPGTDWSAAFK